MIDEVKILRRMERLPDKDVYSGAFLYRGCTVKVEVSGHSLKELKRDCGCDADRVAEEAVRWVGVGAGETSKTLQLPQDLGSQRHQFVKHVKGVKS